MKNHVQTQKGAGMISYLPSGSVIISYLPSGSVIIISRNIYIHARKL